MILVNGVETDHVHVGDRGLHYGDGLFETIVIRNGHPLLWERHLKRLGEGCKRLGIPMPNAGDMECDAARVCAGAERAVLKIIVTRGSGGRGYRAPREAVPTRIVAHYPWPDYPDEFCSQGVAVRICGTRLSSNPQLAGLKHLNRLEQVLARSEWDDPNIPEGLMMDSRDRIIEGTMSNVFLVRDGCLLTPDLSECGVSGIVRGVILERSNALSIPCRVTQLTRQDLQEADELFLTNSIIGIWPIMDLMGTRYALGPVTQRLADELAAVQRRVTP